MSSIQSDTSGRKVVNDSGLLPTTVDPEDLLSCEEAAKLIHQVPKTLATWRCRDRGPEYIKIGRSVYYRRSAISAWLAQQIVRPSAA